MAHGCRYHWIDCLTEILYCVSPQGISTSTEVFNEIMRQHAVADTANAGTASQHASAAVHSGLLDMSTEAASGSNPSSSNRSVSNKRRLFHEQCVRAVGVAIVLHGSMHPAMELLLRHVIQYFGKALKRKDVWRDKIEMVS